MAVGWLLLAPSLTAAGPLDPRQTGARTAVLNPGLRASIDAGRDPSASVELLVRLASTPRSEDYAFLQGEGLTILRTFHAVPIVAVRGPAFSLIPLSANPRVVHVEENVRLQFLMDITTTVINATKVWQSTITDKLGREHPGIDGTGITVVALDSGIDAGHPDLDYGSKVLLNLKSDADGTWTESINTDTSSGHGTHVSGTIAGNGDASQGARRGVAPGANLIGLSTGEAIAILNAVGALEWVYDHTQPGNNPYNIRTISNSWGSNAAYDPNDAINDVSRRLTYDNNVMVVFAAGNAGGDGSDVQTNPYSLEPCVISVAALAHDATDVASFSSRGAAADNFTWPDVGAPGVDIWATEARKTLITASQKSDPAERADSYYMAISGTSMATPHMSGLTALLWQAAPSLHVSNVSDDFNGGQDLPDYFNSTSSRIHEVELILKLTASYLNLTLETPLDGNMTNGTAGLPYDYAQGYGSVRADHAVGLALTLEELRATRPETTVFEAWGVYQGIMVNNTTARRTDVLQTQWHGDWSRLNGATSPIVTSFKHYVYVPNATTQVIVDFTYDPASTKNGYSIGTLGLQIDGGDDGSIDWVGGTGYSNRGSKHYELSPSEIGGTDQAIAVSVDGTGVKVMRPLKGFIDYGSGNEYNELLISYSIGFRFILDVPQNETVTIPEQELFAKWAPLTWGEPSSAANGTPTGSIALHTFYYDLRNATLPEPIAKHRTRAMEVPWTLLLVLVVLAALGAGLYLWRKRGLTLPRALRRGADQKAAQVIEVAEEATEG